MLSSEKNPMSDDQPHFDGKKLDKEGLIRELMRAKNVGLPGLGYKFNIRVKSMQQMIIGHQWPYPSLSNSLALMSI